MCGQLGHDVIGTEHLLLALWAEPDGVAGHVLERLQLEREAVAAAIGDRADRTTGATGGYTPRAWVAIENAGSVALELNHNYVGTEHLLISLAAVAGVAREILTAQELTPDRIRTEVTSLLA